MPNFLGAVWLIHPEHGVHKVPDQPGVIKSFEARGWEVTDLPTDLDSDDSEFIEALEKLQNEADAKPAKTKKSVEAKSATEEEGNK